MYCSKFKPEVFLCLMISVISLAISIASVVTDQWVTGTAKEIEPLNPSTALGHIEVNYGLFSGRKHVTKPLIVPYSYGLSVVCVDGFCMLSCGNEDDLRDVLLGENSSYDTSTGDANLCSMEDKISQLNPAVFHHRKSSLQTTREQNSQRSSKGDDDAAGYDVTNELIRYGLWLSTLIFIFTCIALTFLSIVMKVINTAHTPVSVVFGIEGLVVLNLIIFLCYLIVMSLWAAQFNSRISENLSISETLRVDEDGEKKWSSSGLSSLGYSYWMLISSMILCLANVAVLGYRQYKLYYAPAPKQQKTLEMKVQDFSEGKNMLY